MQRLPSIEPALGQSVVFAVTIPGLAWSPDRLTADLSQVLPPAAGIISWWEQATLRSQTTRNTIMVIRPTICMESQGLEKSFEFCRLNIALSKNGAESEKFSVAIFFLSFSDPYY